MKNILPAGLLLALAFGTFAAPGKLRGAKDAGARLSASDVEGVIIENDRATGKTGYQFVQESRSSLAVIKTSRNLRLQVGSVNCTSSVNNTQCNAFISGGTNLAICKGTNSSCHFVGVRGGIRAKSK